MGETLGILKVRVAKGTRLAVRDFRTSDPYVVLRLGNQVMKTRVINSNLNPVWDEELSFTITSPPRLLKLTKDQPQCHWNLVVGSLPCYTWDPKGHRLSPKGRTITIQGNEAEKELPIWTSQAAAGMAASKGQPEAAGHACDHRAVELEIAVTAGMPVMQDLLGSAGF